MNITRRTFIVSAALAPVACGVPLGMSKVLQLLNPIPCLRLGLLKLAKSGPILRKMCSAGKH